ncbi:MAG: choice-of-anchor V domain-containing protein [Bacteroidota bacterium]
MKRTLTFGIFSIILLACAFMSSSGGRATAAGSGNSGAPGEGTTCITCHGNTGTAVTIDFKLTDADGTDISNYIPGEVYDGTVTISHSMAGPAGYGFQATALKAALDETGDPVVGFSEPSSNAQITSLGNGRQYIEHNGASSDSIFTFKWTAPTDTDGPVSVYVCGNGVNLNGSTGGDNADCTKLELQQRPVSARDLSREVSLSVAPNPVGAELNLLTTSQRSGSFEATIFDLSGRPVLTQSIGLTTGQQQQGFAVGHLAPGFYLLRLTDGQKATTVRFVKQ